MPEFRIESDSLGQVSVPTDRLWGAQTQRSLEHFSIGHELIPREMIGAYAILKRAAATANHKGGRLDKKLHDLIVRVCDELLAGKHDDMFPLHVWMTGSGTQFNMNVNEVIANRSSQLAGKPLGSKDPSREEMAAAVARFARSESFEIDSASGAEECLTLRWRRESWLSNPREMAFAPGFR
jgi:fumarate hydratase, class II